MNDKIKYENEMVIIVDKNKSPLGFLSEKRAKQLLTDGKAVVHSIQPFIIRHKKLDARNSKPLEFKIKIDPGSRETGIAITDLDNNVYYKIIIVHRGQIIVKNKKTQHDARRNRRNRETRYRRCKYPKKGKFKSNRPKGWLPPSVVSIEQNIIQWVKFFSRYVNIVECTVETVAFDFQKMDNPDIQNWEYQHDTKEGKTIRAYLNDKCGRTCQYCGGKTGDHRIEVEHIIAKANGGTDKLSNLTVACHTCNQDKGNLNLDKWLETLKKSNKNIDKERASRISSFLEGNILKPKNYAAWVNSYKTRLIKDLEKFNFKNLELSDGVTTQMNRIQHGLSKQHYNDAACIGAVPDSFKDFTTVAHVITAKGRGSRLRGKTNACGIITVKYRDNHKTYAGFQTGDIVKINKKKGKDSGVYVKRITIRKTGSFAFDTNEKRLGGTVSYKDCTILQRNNGYELKIVHAL